MSHRDQGEDGPAQPPATELLQHRRLLLAFFVRRLRHRQDAEDYVQEVYRRVLSQATPGPVEDWRAFLLGAAGNLLKDGYRRAAVRRRQTGAPVLQLVVTGGPEGTDAIDPERIVGARQQVQRLERALAGLDEQRRQIFVLARLQGMPHREIGERMGLTQGQVGQIVAKLMLRLARETIDP